MSGGGQIRIYVACLAAYNNGILHGAWIDAEQDSSDIHDEIRVMLQASPIPEAEEWAIHDFEGFEGSEISEYEDIESVAEIAAFIAEHGALGGKLLSYFDGLDEAREAMSEHYAGVYESVADFARELTEQSTDIPQNLAYYIDYERMAHDLEINDVESIETGFEQVHIFWRH